MHGGIEICTLRSCFHSAVARAWQAWQSVASVGTRRSPTTPYLYPSYFVGHTSNIRHADDLLQTSTSGNPKALLRAMIDEALQVHTLGE